MESLGGGTSADLGQLGGDLGLATAVVNAAQGLAELLGVVGGIAHGVHAGGKLAGQRLLEGAEQLGVEVQGQEGIQDLGRLLLEDEAAVKLASGDGGGCALNAQLAIGGGKLEDLVIGGVDAVAVNIAELALGAQGHQSLDNGGGGDEGHELGEDHLDLVDLARHEVGVDLVGNALGLLAVGVLAKLDLLDHVVLRAALEVGDSLLANAHEADLNALGHQLVGALLGL